MTDSSDRWAEVEKAVELAKDSTRFLVTPEYPCLLELRARVQELEEDSQKQAERARFCVDALVERIEALEANVKLTTNSSQIRRCLLTDLAFATTRDGESPDYEVCRAILWKVAHWLRDYGGWTQASVAGLLESEAKR